MIIFTLILSILCQQGLGVVSWFIVFIPFIFMTVITTVLLFAFGLDPKKGKYDYSVNKNGVKESTTSSGIVRDPVPTESSTSPTVNNATFSSTNYVVDSSGNGSCTQGIFCEGIQPPCQDISYISQCQAGNNITEVPSIETSASSEVTGACKPSGTSPAENCDIATTEGTCGSGCAWQSLTSGFGNMLNSN